MSVFKKHKQQSGHFSGSINLTINGKVDKIANLFFTGIGFILCIDIWLIVKDADLYHCYRVFSKSV